VVQIEIKEIKPRGRPPKREEEKKKHIVSVKLTDSELELLKNAMRIFKLEGKANSQTETIIRALGLVPVHYHELIKEFEDRYNRIKRKIIKDAFEHGEIEL